MSTFSLAHYGLERRSRRKEAHYSRSNEIKASLRRPPRLPKSPFPNIKEIA